MTGVAAAVGVAFLIAIASGEAGAALKVGLIIGVLGFGIAYASKRPMITKLKGGINGAIAGALGLKYSAAVTPGPSFDRAKLFELVPAHDAESFEDLWWGVVGTRPFTLHEARLTERRGSGKHRRTVVVFSGSILTIGYARHFQGTTLIEADGQRRRFFVGGEKDTVQIGGLAMNRIDLLNPEFEGRFTVWSNDPVEARYLIHPAYIERLVAVEEAFAGHNIRALFHDGELLIVLESGDQFESGSLEARDDHALLERSIAQFGSLVDLAVQLNERERMTLRDLPPVN